MKSLEELEEENESLKLQVDNEEKKALIAEAKRRYGKDWRKIFDKTGGISSGIDWQAMKFQI